MAEKTVKPLQFSSGQEMLDLIIAGHDLYSAEKQLYVFCYNDVGSVAYYQLDLDEARELAQKPAVLKGEYWGAYLGIGGRICDDPSYELFTDGDFSNLDFCEEHYQGTDWILTTQFLERY